MAEILHLGDPAWPLGRRRPDAASGGQRLSVQNAAPKGRTTACSTVPIL
ncbi:MAG: hypothetical protein ACLSHC_00600 [Bilophila wadsworthia]